MPPDHTNPTASGAGRSALLVGSGILLSRIAGLIRDRVFAHYFGNSAAADAFRAAFRIPNLLQNLFGEGVLSASFIPVYSRLLAHDAGAEADRVAGAILAILACVVSVLVFIGVLTTPYLIDVIVPGFTGEKRDLTVQLVRILFPGAGLLVLSAWCLGILNSHGRFFMSYAAPVIWNVAMIATLIGFGSRQSDFALAIMLAWGSVAGSALQVGVQMPTVLRLARHLRPSFDTTLAGVRTVLRNFGPVFLGRGVVQISAYVDAFIASFLPTGAVAALSYAQTLYILPVSLFGMAVSAAELPAMSRARGDAREISAYLQHRLDSGLRRVAYFVVPSAVAFLALGDIIVAAIYQSGRFTSADALYVWGILAGAAIGLLAATCGRLYASAYYALGDTRTPLKYAVARIMVATSLGYFSAMGLPPLLGIETRWGVAGLTAGSSVAAWIELMLLRRSLNRRIGYTRLPPTFLMKLAGAAAAGAALAWGIKLAIGPQHPLLAAILILSVYGMAYVGITLAWEIREAEGVVRRFARLRGKPER